MHDKGVDIALFRVVEGFGQATYDFKAEFLPKADGNFVCADDDVELHGAKAAVSSSIERMRAHGAGNATSRSPGSGHVSTIGNMAASALLVGAEVISAEDFSVFFGNECLVIGRVPVFERLLAGEVAREGIGFSGADGGFENLPDGVCIFE